MTWVARMFEQELAAVVTHGRLSPERSTIRVDVPAHGVWYLDYSSLPPVCATDTGQRADCSVRLDEATLTELLGRPDRAAEFKQAGRITVSGERVEAVSLLWESLVYLRKPSRLHCLFEPIGVDRVLSGWTCEPVHCHAPVGPLLELLGIPELADVRSLLGVWRGALAIHHGSSDTSAARPLPAPAALKALRRPCNLSFEHMELQFAPLRPWLAQLGAELGLPPSVRRKCLGYFSSRGCGTQPHFDDNTNIVLQLQGEKHWQFAPNHEVVNPSFRYLVGPNGGKLMGLRPELQWRSRPTVMPGAGRTTIVARPGTVLVVPRGWWHTTTAEADSLALNFWFTSPSWAGLALQALANRLVSEERWRAVAQGAGATGESRATAVEQFDQLLAELPRLVAELKADAVFLDSRADDPFAQFRWPPFARAPLIEWPTAPEPNAAAKPASLVARLMRRGSARRAGAADDERHRGTSS